MAFQSENSLPQSKVMDWNRFLGSLESHCESFSFTSQAFVPFGLSTRSFRLTLYKSDNSALMIFQGDGVAFQMTEFFLSSLEILFPYAFRVLRKACFPRFSTVPFFFLFPFNGNKFMSSVESLWKMRYRVLADIESFSPCLTMTSGVHPFCTFSRHVFYSSPDNCFGLTPQCFLFSLYRL